MLLSGPLYHYDDKSEGLNKDIRDSLPASPRLLDPITPNFEMDLPDRSSD